MSQMQVRQLITQLNLKPHPEGGYYRRTYQSNLQLNYNSIGTAIYYLLEGSDFSCWHRLKSDEMWHFYGGEALNIHEINGEGEYKITLLGNSLMNKLATYQHVVKGGTWFAAEVVSKEAFALVGCTLTPGFDDKQFEIGKRKDLLKCFPQHADIVQRLTREND